MPSCRQRRRAYGSENSVSESEPRQNPQLTSSGIIIERHRPWRLVSSPAPRPSSSSFSAQAPKPTTTLVSYLSSSPQSRE